RGSERAGLIASGVECHPPVNHHADRPPRHDEQNDNHGLRQDAHLLPERNRVPTDRALVKEPGGEKMEITKCDCCQVHYHELLSSSRTVSNFQKISPLRRGSPVSLRGRRRDKPRLYGKTGANQKLLRACSL